MKIWLKNKKSKTLFEPFQWSIFWAIFQRSNPSISSNHSEKNKGFLKLHHFSGILTRNNKGSCKNHRKQFGILTKFEPLSKDTQDRHHLKFQGIWTKSSIILVAMKILANCFSWYTVRVKKVFFILLKLLN